ncbi:MAG: hypothetical protein HGA51_02270 [Demequinaceae bacterium]|nr:hypothetical protein [Demequinaceae bacterium]
MTPTAQPLAHRLMLEAPGHRHGLTLLPQVAPVSMSDVASITHVGIPRRVSAAWESAAGGVGRDERVATLAAVGEAVERTCAALARPATRRRDALPPDHRIDPDEWHLFTPQQRERPDFPFGELYGDALPYVEVAALSGGAWWAPETLVVMRDEASAEGATSSGLAAATTRIAAIARALMEIIERDALMVTWLGALPGREVPLPLRLAAEAEPLGAQCHVFDLTPAYSPVPVAAVAGGIDKSGVRRLSLGVACKPTWDEAVEKAYLEWNQGVLFAGLFGEHARVETPLDPSALRTFDEHAIYYTQHPELWDRLPLWGNAIPAPAPEAEVRGDDAAVVSAITAAFEAHSIRAGWVDLTTIDARQVGLNVVRAVSPDLASIFAHQAWPHLHRVEKAIPLRYPALTPCGPFPQPMPHPLG